MKIYSSFLPLTILLLFADTGRTQNQTEISHIEKQAHSVLLGPRFGRTLIYLDTRMRSHYRFGAGLQFVAGHKLLWDLGLEYYEADGGWGARVFEYKGYTLLVRNVQYITAYTLNLALSKLVARFASTGLGLSLDYFRVESTVNNRTYPFYIDFRTDSFGFFGEEVQTFRFLAPGLFIVNELHYPLGRSFQVYLEQKTKVAYIGKNYHAHPLNSWITFTVYGGVRVKI